MARMLDERHRTWIDDLQKYRGKVIHEAPTIGPHASFVDLWSENARLDLRVRLPRKPIRHKPVKPTLPVEDVTALHAAAAILKSTLADAVAIRAAAALPRRAGSGRPRASMSPARIRTALRFDGGFWRRFAELGCIYGPEWLKRASPPAIAAIVYAVARRQRAAVLANQRQVRGARGWLRERWDAYRVFAEFAWSVTEAMEQWGPRPPALDFRARADETFAAALAEGRGLIVVTGHFGSWEVATRGLGPFGRRVNMVTAHELNASAQGFVHAQRTRFESGIIYSDGSPFAGLTILQALRRGEIVGMQIDPWGPLPGSYAVEFCGRSASFQLGPFTIARVARAPLIVVFALRTGIRQYELRARRFDPRTAAESVAALEATVRAYESVVRERPAQWLMFQPVWPDDAGRKELGAARRRRAPEVAPPTQALS
jgi:lauroyl/myristoyl acyltransferase